MNPIKFSEKFMKKAGIKSFAQVYRSHFMPSIVLYMIDSNQRKAYNLSKWYNEQIDNVQLPLIAGSSKDAIAVECLKFVQKNIKYTRDNVNPNFLRNELWQTPAVTYTNKTGDCEDGALLLGALMIQSGINPEQIMLVCGDVVTGYNAKAVYEGHCWLEYIAEVDGVPRILDWCYWPCKYNDIELYPNIFADEKYPRDRIWFAFNTLRYYGKYSTKKFFPEV
jgi:predicted transglutaminase-like cysteine proteinase